MMQSRVKRWQPGERWASHVALSTAWHHMRRTSHSPVCPQLVIHLRRLQRLKGSAPTAAGDWAHLPPDLLLRTFDAACAGGALPTAASLLCVCGAWRAVAQQAPQLWVNLDLTRLRLKRSAEGLVAAARRGTLSGVQRLVCGPDTPLPAKGLLALLAACGGTLRRVTLTAPVVAGLRGENLEGPLLSLHRLTHLRLDAISVAPERT
jgi:F-box-like